MLSRRPAPLGVLTKEREHAVEILQVLELLEADDDIETVGDAGAEVRDSVRQLKALPGHLTADGYLRQLYRCRVVVDPEDLTRVRSQHRGPVATPPAQVEHSQIGAQPACELVAVPMLGREHRRRLRSLQR